jgi:putative DNA methylase
VVLCPNCQLNIPLSTNFHVIKKKGKPEQDLAAFPQVPPRSQGNDCTFRIAPRDEWGQCRWPRPDFERWHPTGTPTFKDGKAICPRCGHIMDGEEVKAVARSREGGLASQLYAVCSQVPVRLTYRNGEEKTRWLWRFRAPRREDMDAIGAAEAELRRLLPQWEAKGLVPNEEVPEGEKTREPRNMGIVRFRDFFLPRQLLTNLVILEETLAAQELAKAELPADQAEAVGVYLAFILDKVVSYNNVCTTWHSGRKTVRSNFSGHDYRFEGSFCEFEGARETVQWGASQVVDAYEQLAGLIHGGPVELTGEDEGDGDAGEEERDAAGKGEDLEGESETIGNETPATAIALREIHIRPEVIVPTVTCEDAAALSNPPSGSVHLICVDPPYYHNVQYGELANFFYVWMKRSVGHYPSLELWFREPLTDSFREAVANETRFRRDTDRELNVWQARNEDALVQLQSQKVKVTEARKLALARVGPKPTSAKDRAHQFYQGKMAQVFRRSRQLLHASGRLAWIST